MKRFLWILFLLPVVANAQIYTNYVENPASRDAFGRQSVSQANVKFDAQLTYGLQPLMFDTITVGTGATITHDTTNNWANLAFSSTSTGGKVFMQTFEYFRYQPGISQDIFITFNMHGGGTNVDKIAGYSDGLNGIEFVLNDTTPQVRILSGTDNGDESVDRVNWNVDHMDGSGPSGVALDFTKTQILVIDFEALYVGRVRIGWNVDGNTYFCHYFTHANEDTYPYFQTANLPVRVGMTCSGTVTDSIHYICASVISDGGGETHGFGFTASSGVVTAANGTDTHIISIQPKTTFNNRINRTKIKLESIDILVVGNSPIKWTLCLGQALTSTATADVNSTYSSTQTITGTLSGTPAIKLDGGYGAATATAKSAVSRDYSIRIPVTLDHEGAVRDLGRITVLCQGLGATSDVRVILNWTEIR